MDIPYFRQDINRTARYCELVAATAFLQRGHDIAFPFGNQRGWDMLVEFTSGHWTKIQVKSARPHKISGATVCLKRSGGRIHRLCSEGDFDQLAAVLPELGTIWLVPFGEVKGRQDLTVQVDGPWVWMAGVAATVRNTHLPKVNPNLFREPYPRNRSSKYRDRLIELNLSVRPEWLRESTWDMLIQFKKGYGLKLIGDRYGLAPKTVWERMSRAMDKLTKICT